MELPPDMPLPASMRPICGKRGRASVAKRPKSPAPVSDESEEESGSQDSSNDSGMDRMCESSDVGTDTSETSLTSFRRNHVTPLLDQPASSSKDV